MKLKHYTLMTMLALLVGCSSKPTLYYWGDYQPELYEYFKNPQANPEGQIVALKKIIEVAKSKNKQVPPGLYAQLGMLYTQTGNLPSAEINFEQERAAFPESSQFMSFLIKNMQGNSHDK